MTVTQWIRRAVVSMGVVLLCVALAPAQKDSDWPQFRGPGGQGISSDSGLPVKWSATESVVWKADLPGAGTSSPVIVGDRIYLTCYSGYNVPGRPAGSQDQLRLHMVALDRATGKLVWNTTIEPRLPEQANIRDNHGYSTSTPFVDGDRIYAFFGKTGVFAFDLTGKQIWRADVGDRLNGWGSAASPIVAGNLVIVNASVESDTLFAFDKSTGKEAWRVRGIRESWNTPVLVKSEEGKTELVLAIQGKVLGLEPTTGAQLWSCATDIGWYMVPSVVAHDGVVYCIGGRSGVAALAVRTGGKGDVTRTHRLWTSEKGSNVSSPVFHNGHLYFANDSRAIAYCTDPKTGKVLYEERLPRADGVYASAVLGDGKIYYVSRSGRVFVVAAKPEFELLATNDLGTRSVFDSSPAIAGRRIFLRSNQHLYCLGEK